MELHNLQTTICRAFPMPVVLSNNSLSECHLLKSRTDTEVLNVEIYLVQTMSPRLQESKILIQQRLVKTANAFYRSNKLDYLSIYSSLECTVLSASVTVGWTGVNSPTKRTQPKANCKANLAV